MLTTKGKIVILTPEVLRATTKLNAENDYKFYKFTRELRKVFDAIIEEDRELMERNGITASEQGIINPGGAGYEDYMKMRKLLLEEELELEIKYKFDYPIIAGICADNRINQGVKMILCELLLEEKHD